MKHGRRSLAVLLVAVSVAAAGSEAVLPNGVRVADSELIACAVDSEQTSAMLLVDERKWEAPGLVRWGEPAPVQRRPALVLANGSRLLSDRTWSPLGLVRVGDDSVRLRRGKSWVELSRRDVAWVVLDAEAAGLDLEGQLNEPPEVDEVWLVGGDQVTGNVIELTAEALKVEVGGESIDTPLEAIAAVRFASQQRANRPACLVGLTDGSLVRAETFGLSDRVATLRLAGAEFQVPAKEIAVVQPLPTDVTYLSDLEPVSYRHTPYLDLVWPFVSDHGLRGSALFGGGSRRAKGLAVHSAASLVYRLDGSHTTFRADLAVADPPLDSSAAGSVVFRVYLVQEGKFVPTYESEIVRSGDAAVPIAVDLAGAAALALIVDYADGGDAGDEALWLDARLEP